MDKDPRAEASLPQPLLCAGPASESLCPLLPRTPYDTFTDGILGPTETLAKLSIVEVKRGVASQENASDHNAGGMRAGGDG